MGMYFNSYLNVDINLPQEYAYVFDMIGFLKWNITWNNFKYDQVYLDMNTVKFDLIRSDDNKLLYFDFPALKKWHIEADEHINTWIFPQSSHVELDVVDFDIDFETGLVLDDNGYLDPAVK
jgi:hypothetical protein